MSMLVLDAAIELLGQYQRELQVRAIHLNLSVRGNIDVSIVPSMENGAPELVYGRIDRVTRKFTQSERSFATEVFIAGVRSKAFVQKGR